jgi:hypothetical protein
MPIKITTHRPDLSVPITKAQASAIQTEAVPAPPKIEYTTTAQLWKELHSRALNWTGEDDSKWLLGFTRRVPCGECQRHWAEFRMDRPPDWANYFDWTVEAHNSVNHRLGKKILTTDEAKALYQDSGKL